MTKPKQKRVAVVGAGAAGMAAAYSLARSTSHRVTVYESSTVPGGVACTFDHKGSRVNYGVQGGTFNSHQNTVELMKEFGREVVPVELAVSFGKGEHHWTNKESTALQARLRPEIERFGRLLRWVSRLEFITIFISINTLLWLFRFSKDFRYRMVYPLVALFFGTGNVTPRVSAAVIARIFNDKNMRIFDYSAESLLDQTPKNIAFPDLESFYLDMQAALRERGVEFLMETSVERVVRGKEGTTVHSRPSRSADVAKSTSRMFDAIIMACPADTALGLLERPGFAERRVLGSVEYFRDITVTHSDRAYMERHYDMTDDKAMYFIKTYERDPARLEMAFDLTNYQPSLMARQSSEDRVYQTIFLDKKHEDLWTKSEITASCVLHEASWWQFSHTSRHFSRVVPWVGIIQGGVGGTYFCGSWTMFNTHDIAIASGFAAAYRLGAPFPFPHNDLACDTFNTVLNVSHYKRAEKTKDGNVSGKAKTGRFTRFDLGAPLLWRADTHTGQ